MDAWKLHEKRLAYLFGGKRVAGSGCGYRKGDIWIGKDWMVECKTTGKQQFRLTVNMLDKLAKQSLESGLSAALVVVFHHSYEHQQMLVLVLHRRREGDADWRSRIVSPGSLRPGETVLSRYGEWTVMDIEQFRQMLY
ncbi:MAG: hypothetical protein KatS3mg023_3751 [Armatimonadota bacterium]|jgi:Holliday junction resolvase|nr:MAG: hypothetical protein KatS3mg023_3751 [Armatimonadota bacterium]